MQAAVLDLRVSFAEHSRRAGSPSAAALQRTRAILAASMAQAEAQAEDFGRPTMQGRGVWQWLIAVCAVLLVAGGATLYLKETVAPRVTEPAVAAVVIASGEAGVTTNPFAPPRSAATNAAAAANASVRREGDALVLELHNAPLGQAIAELANVTRTTVVGQPGDARVSLHWRGSNTTAAWQALLAGESGYALACDLPETATNCRVWLAANQTTVQQ